MNYLDPSEYEAYGLDETMPRGIGNRRHPR